MTMIKGQFANLLIPGFRKTHFEDLKAWASMFAKFLNVNSSTRAFEEDQYVPGLGVIGEKPEGSAITYADTQYGGKVRYTHVSYGGGFRITRELFDDDLYAVMNRMNRAHARGVNQTIETVAHQVLNSGFTTELGWTEGDGTARALFHTAHVLTDLNTKANRPSPDVSLSQTAIQAGIIRGKKMTDERSIPVMIPFRMLLCPVDLRFKAKELLMTELKPDSADNTVNALQGEGLTWSDDIFLSSTTAWFLLSAKTDHDLQFLWRTKPEYNGADDFDTGDAKFKSFLRFSKGHGDFRGTDGTTGV